MRTLLEEVVLQLGRKIEGSRGWLSHKVLAGKPEDLSSIPRAHVRSQYGNPCAGEVETGGFRGSLAS